MRFAKLSAMLSAVIVRLPFTSAALAAVLACALAGSASAQWRATGTIAAYGTSGQSRAVTAHDGAGGVYVVWEDLRNNGVSNGQIDLFAQHILASGALDPAWGATGIAVGSGPYDQRAASIIPDGAGGAFVAWTDRRSGSMLAPYMQHLLRTGVDPAWPANGRLLSNYAGSFTLEVAMVRDGGTGVYALCAVPGTGTRHYVQHVLANGTLDANFTAAGLLAGSVAAGLSRSSIVSDKAGGAIVVWPDAAGIYAMHVLSTGLKDALWPAAGRNLQTSGSAGTDPVAVADGIGGALVVWSQNGVSTRDIYAQNVLIDGTLDPNFPAAGLVVCDAAGSQQNPSITTDGSTGAYVTWQDYRNGTDCDVYVQHVQGWGPVDPIWPANGRAISTGTGNQIAFALVPDNYYLDTIVLWYDTGGPLWNVLAQRIGGNGVVEFAWPAGGAVVTTPYPADYVPAGCSSDSLGGAIMAWSRLRGGSFYEILARKLPYLGTHRITVTPPTGGNVYLSDPDSLQMSTIDITPAEITDFRFAPSGANYVSDVSVSGTSQGVPPNYRFSNVTLDRTLTVSFASTPWSISTSTPGVSYVPMGLPVTFADSSVSALLPTLWPANDAVWRLAHWDPISARYVFASDSLAKLQAGAGYWLATMAARTISVPGTPITAASVSVPLLGGAASGWNQVANPYRFPIADSALAISTGGPAVAFTSGANTATDHALYDWAGGSSYTAVHTMQPNRSYWVHKLVDGTVTLKFPNRSSVGPPPGVAGLPAGAEWAVGIVARQGADATGLVMAGAGLASRDEATPLRRESPPPSPQGGLALHVGEPGDARVRQMADFVPAGGAQSWVVEISGASAPGEVQLEISGYDLPAGLSLWLGDPADGWKRPVHVGETVAIAAYATSRRLTLEANHELPGAAAGAGLRVMSAYPNPFQHHAGFMCALPLGGDVHVQILDLQGRLVRSLERRGAPAGENVLVWDGRSASGAAVRPGVYLARYQAGGAAGTVRLVKIN